MKKLLKYIEKYMPYLNEEQPAYIQKRNIKLLIYFSSTLAVVGFDAYQHRYFKPQKVFKIPKEKFKELEDKLPFNIVFPAERGGG